MYGVGSIKGKAKLADIVKEYKLPMNAVAVILKTGELKYPSYSWYNNYTDPKADSTIECNINAMLRHFTAHRMGFCVDPDSRMPHIFHLACRVALLITTYYLSNTETVRYSEQLSKPTNYNSEESIGIYIPAEVIYSLNKSEGKLTNNTKEQLEVIINDLLFKLTIKIPNFNGFQDTAPNSVDTLLKAVFEYVKLYIKDSSLITDFKKTIDGNFDKSIAAYLHSFLG